MKIRKIFLLFLACFCILQTYAENISFVDEKVKDICVAKWDTNTDGELSEEEAAAVTDLGTVFRFKSSIESFDELRYFTGLTSIAPNAFYYCSALKSISFPEGVTVIKARAFYNCIALQHITIPSNVLTLEGWAFNSCSGLTSLDIENGLTTIGEFAFANCLQLKNLHISSSVKEMTSNVFENCISLEEISVDEGNTVFDSRDGCNAIIETKSNTLFLGCKNTVIPSTITTIGDGAFMGCSGLNYIEIPESVTTIDTWAFSDCSSLKQITIPKSLKTIEYGAFWGCEKLQTIDFSEGLTTIGASAFRNCSALKCITLPASLSEIGDECFYASNNLNEVRVHFSSPMSIDENTFPTRKKATLYVPAGTVSAFKSAQYWKDFYQIVEWFPTGDVNHDGSVNVLDVTLVIDYILDKKPENFHYEEANVNGDEYINVLDVTKIIDIILGK